MRCRDVRHPHPQASKEREEHEEGEDGDGDENEVSPEHVPYGRGFCGGRGLRRILGKQSLLQGLNFLREHVHHFQDRLYPFFYKINDRHGEWYPPIHRALFMDHCPHIDILLPDTLCDSGKYPGSISVREYAADTGILRRGGGH